MKKRVLAVMLTLCMVLALLPAGVLAADGGSYSDTINWSLDDDGTLSITGTGVVVGNEYVDGDYKAMPWDDSRDLIKRIALGEGITGIEGEWTFAELENLESVSLPESLTVIGYEAFMNDPKLTHVTVPAGVREIGSRAFGLCETLTEINVAAGNQYYASEDGVLFNKDKSTLIQYPCGKSGDTYTFPASVQVIDVASFECCNHLTSIAIPDSVQSIGLYAFDGCENLAQITIGDGVEKLGGDVFYGTAYYQDDSNWENGVLYIGNYLMKAKEELAGDYTVKSGVRALGGNAFNRCSNLTSITLPESVIYVGGDAFWDCDNLTGFVFPQGVKTVEDYTFYGCNNLASVQLPDTITSIGESAFWACEKLTEIEIPASVQTIGEEAFCICNSLTDVYYGGSEELWQKINIGRGNEPLTGATMHYKTVFTITFHPGEGTVTPETAQTQETSGKLAELPTPIRNGYRFNGWFTAAEGGERITTDTVFGKDTTIYAQWRRKTSSGNSGGTVTPGPKPDEEKPPASQFSDVPADSYYADAVTWAVEKGVTTGTSDTTFAPNKSCTRAEAVTFLWRAAGSTEPETAKCPFTDVVSGSYYEKAVLWAVEKGITTGTSKSTFGPGDVCNRAQIVTFLWRMEGKQSVAGSNAFTDVAAGTYYKDAVQWAVKNEITNGTSSTTFSPLDNCIRAQIVTFLYRSHGK